MCVRNWYWRLKETQTPNVQSHRWPGNVGCEKIQVFGMHKDDEVRERTQQEKKVVWNLKTVTWNRGTNNNVKKSLYDSIVITTLTYGSETWMMFHRHRPKTGSVEASYVRGGCIWGYTEKYMKKCGSAWAIWCGWVCVGEYKEEYIKMVWSNVKDGWWQTDKKERVRVRWRVLEGEVGQRWGGWMEWKKYASESGKTWMDVQQMIGNRVEWRNFVVATLWGNKALGKRRKKKEVSNCMRKKCLLKSYHRVIFPLSHTLWASQAKIHPKFQLINDHRLKETRD